MNTIDFSELVGEKASLYYCNYPNRFQLGKIIFEVMEDESDGYRSYLDKVVIVDNDAPLGTLIDKVTIRSSTEIDEGYDLVSDDEFVWLTFGTDNTDDYYPYFVFRTNVRPTISDIKSLIK